jgi:hypothetical protein
MAMKVSVIIPARNAAETISDTLNSLLRQTFPHWEAVVIDDGSQDSTAVIVKSFAQQDTRFRLLRQPQIGVSRARNYGLAHTSSSWLLFLDADDWILPTHLERLTHVLEADSRPQVAYCGWAYVAPDGEQIFGEFGGRVGDLFAQHARYCFSVIHTYLVRRSLVEAVGGFDPALQTCEDWDLWQRIARTGAWFGTVREKLAAYRIRPGSATRNSRQLLADGLQVLTRGHSADPRMPQRHPMYPQGFPSDQLARNKFNLLCACAGYMIGRGEDAHVLLEMLKEDRCSALHPYEVAMALFVHTMVSTCQPRSEWYGQWPGLAQTLEEFLKGLESRSRTPRLVFRVRLLLEGLIAKYAKDPGLSRHFRFIPGFATLSLYKARDRTRVTRSSCRQLLKFYYHQIRRR